MRDFLLLELFFLEQVFLEMLQPFSSHRAIKLVHAPEQPRKKFGTDELRRMQRESTLLGRIHNFNVANFYEAGLSSDANVKSSSPSGSHKTS
jgi:hypothetical protein